MFVKFIRYFFLVCKDKKAVIKQAKELLIQVGIEKEMWNKFPSQLSGGEAQRIGIVRALINSPTVVFADEPTGALNSMAGQAVLDIFSSIYAERQSIVMVTHDIKTAIRGNRILYVKDGCIYGELKMEAYQAEKQEQRRKRLQIFLD